MKNLLLFLPILFFISLGFVSDSGTIRWVNDQEDILTEVEEQSLASLYIEHEKKTSNQIVFVSTSDLQDSKSIMEFAVNYGHKNGIGLKEKNNGVVISVSKNLRKTFIATGYGTEKVLDDFVVKKYIDSLMIPKFKTGDYYTGVLSGSLAIIAFLENPENEIK